MASFNKSEGEGTVIGTHVKLTGVLADPNDILVLGKLEGEVHSDHTVTVGPNAVVKGPVTAKRIVLEGSLRGNAHASERLEILPKGNLTGNTETRDLVVHSGAMFNGRSQMIGGEHKNHEVEKEVEQEAETPTAENAPDRPARRWPPIRLAGLGRKNGQNSSEVPNLSDDKPNEKNYEVE